MAERLPSRDVEIAWKQFKQTAAEELTVFWQRHVGTAEAIYGVMADMSAEAANPEIAARQFLATEAALFKLHSVEDLRLLGQTESGSGHHLFFEQTYRGLPVYHALMDVPGMIGVHLTPSGYVHAVVNSSVPAISLKSVQPRVTADRVYGAMLAELGQSHAGPSLLYESRRALVVYATPQEARLAWQITIPAREPLGTWEAFWDAQTGQRLSAYMDRNYYADGVGRVFVTNPVAMLGKNDLTDQRDSAAAVPESAYVEVTLSGLDNSGFLTGPYVNTRLTANRINRPDRNFTNLNRSHSPGFEEVQTYWSVTDSQQYIRQLGLYNVVNYSIPCNINGITADNSFYISDGGGRGRLTFGSGGVDDAEDAEIIWHEYGHAILDHQVPNMNQNFDGMGEGWADYWACTNAARHPSADHAVYDPAEGEWDAVSYNPGNPPFLRRVDTNAHYPEDRHSDPHVTGMIWSRALWDIRQALGPAVADRLFLEGNFLMPFAPTLPQAAQAMLQADKRMTEGSNQAIMRAAFEARGLIAPAGAKMDPVDRGESWQTRRHSPASDSNGLMVSEQLGEAVSVNVGRNGGPACELLLARADSGSDEHWPIKNLLVHNVMRISTFRSLSGARDS
ncbi:MAG: M36 family metallopeptidase [Acidobacteriota bacterium]|nr:M36 family metallopeptidase [Blastocatellia bacterium]MDW8238629.1 M36 family metallopeptidase [Acidobacteriota bacterium]